MSTKKRKNILIIAILLLIIISIFIFIFILLPLIEFDINNKIIYISYNDDFSKYEDYTCYHESVSYNEKKNISITDIDIKKYFIFYKITLKYEKGNLCEREYLLEENYIKRFINEAEIIDNPNNINLKELIKDKKPIVGNTRYFDNDYETYIEYKLDDKYETMYIFYNEDLLIIQVGNPDETIKFIAYK